MRSSGRYAPAPLPPFQKGAPPAGGGGSDFNQTPYENVPFILFLPFQKVRLRRYPTRSFHRFAVPLPFPKGGKALAFTLTPFIIVYLAKGKGVRREAESEESRECRNGWHIVMAARERGIGRWPEAASSPIPLRSKDSYGPDILAYPTGTSLCIYAVEPPCTEPYARWCGRTVTQLTGDLLPDWGERDRREKPGKLKVRLPGVDSS